MGWFTFLKGPDVNEGVQECRNTEGALLLDVRTPEEYGEGHIAGSLNMPLQSVGKAQLAAGKDTPLYVYCYSGARSRQAAATLRRMGYANVKDIGGIAAWTGEVEH